MDKIPEGLKLLLKAMGIVPEAPESWIDYAELDAEDKQKCQNLRTTNELYGRELDELDQKIHTLKAKMLLQGQEWWRYLKTKYALPENTNFMISADGRLLRQLQDLPPGSRSERLH